MSRRRSVLILGWLTSLVASYRLGAANETALSFAPRVSIVAASPLAPPAPAQPRPMPSRSHVDDAASLTPAEFVARGVIAKYLDEDNPLNRNQRAYVLGGAEDIVPAQVGLRAVAPNRILFSQYPSRGATLRTFSIAID